MAKYKLHIIWAVVAVAALVAGVFWGKGMAAGSSSRSLAAGSFPSSTRTFAGRAGGASGGGFVMGQVASVGSSSLTLQLANGNSEIVFYSTSTAVTEPQAVPASRIASGATVVITGTPNADGSFDASSIQVGGAGGFRGGSGASSSGQ